MATYTVDWFTTLDGFGSGPVAFWGKEGPELLAQRDRSLGTADQILVLGANTYCLMERFASAQDDPGFAAPREACKIVISKTLQGPLSLPNATLLRRMRSTRSRASRWSRRSRCSRTAASR